MRRWLLAILCLSIVGCGGRGATTTGRDRDGSITVGGTTRTYQLHLPSQQTGIMPVLVVLHGHGGAGVGTITLTHMNELADQDGFLAVYPDGLSKGWADGRGASEPDHQGIDDVAFLGHLITALQAQYVVDPHRIYVMGISNGGFMAQRLGCELGDKIAAIVPVVATLSTNQAANCAPTRPMPILYVLGESDPLVPFNGGTVNGDRGAVLSATDSIATWARFDGCVEPPTTRTLPDRVQDRTHVSQTLYTTCRSGAQVGLFSVAGAATPGRTASSICRWRSLAARPIRSTTPTFGRS
jgi:polyhydroxybutyrate depolymerase